MTFTSCPNRKLKFTIKQNHISTTARGKFTICALLYRSLILKKIFTKRWPQLDLYFLYKPEVKVYYLKKIISQQPQEVNSQFLHHCTDRCLSKNIYKKVTPIRPLLPVQTGSESLLFKTNHISTTARDKFTIFALLYRSLILKKYLQKGDPN